MDKLKKLSVVTLASQNKSLAYDVLMRELEARAVPVASHVPARGSDPRARSFAVRARAICRCTRCARWRIC